MLILVRPRADDAHQRIVHESRWVGPADIDVSEFQDLHGNTCWRLTAPGGC